MEITYSLLNAITKPGFLCRDKNVDSELLESTPSEVPWEHSPLNPQKRIDTLDNTLCGWRVDGANILGRQLYAVPTGLLPDLVPSGVYVYLPGEQSIPKELRYALDYGQSVVLRHGPHVARTGLVTHVCHALDAHCRHEPEFFETYRKLPYGSQLIFDEICVDPSQMKLHVAPNYDMERQTQSVAALKKKWSDVLSPEQWPTTLDISCLRLERVLHDSVSVVHIMGCSGDTGEKFVFKSSISDLSSLYNELRFLLRCKPHRHIMARPLHVVTKKQAFGGKRGVYGFILPYYSGGSMRDFIPADRLNRQLTISVQLKWIRQVADAMLHIQEECGTFYSDLRPDNILMTGKGNVVLIDFEQRGNWYEWCAPEIRYRMYKEHLIGVGVKEPTCLPLASRMAGLLDAAMGDDVRESFSPPVTEPQSTVSRTSRNVPWLALTTAAREKAMVFSLGLLMYCIFEGVCNPKVSLTNSWPVEPHVEFPHFRRTPAKMQTYIKWCTRGAPEWNDAGSALGCGRFTRQGICVVVEEPPGPSNAVNAPQDMLQTISCAWEEEIELASKALQGVERISSRLGEDRPTLEELVRTLDAVEANAMTSMAPEP